jgi:signal transduction histidine kinase
MHDSVAKTLHGLQLSAMSLDGLAQRDPDRARIEAKRIREAAEVASKEARALLDALRVDDLERPLAQVVRDEVDAFVCGRDLEAAVSIVGTPDPDPEVRHELLQTMREALSNVVRHARASRIEVALRQTDGRLELQVDDDGVGIERPDPALLAKHGHYGIAGLHERARLLGGQVTVGASPLGGTRVLLTAPVETETVVAG